MPRTDKILSNRIKQCLPEFKNSEYTDISDIVEYLQKQYPEYRRKRKHDFRKYVAEIYSQIGGDGNISNSGGNSNQKSKKMKVDFCIDRVGEKDSSSEFSDDNPNYEHYEDKNVANNSLMSLYNTPPAKNGGKTERSVQNRTIEPLVNSTKSKSRRQNDEELKEVSNALKPKADSKRQIKKKETQLVESKYSFSDVGGNEKCLKEVCYLLAHMKHPEVHEKLNVHPPRGFLLHGPPGCGKTLLAQAIAGELQIPLIKIAATEVVSGVSGESEEKIRELFDKAVVNSPCILFFDEIDAIAPKRESVQREMERRIVSQLLTCLDDLNQKASAHQVFVIGATNRPDSIDPALRRGGRFDREICMGIPDQDARLKILRIMCKELGLEPDFNFKTLAENTPGYVGADLMSLIQEASMVAVDRVFISLQSSPDGSDHRKITEQDPNVPSYKQLLLWLKEYPPLNNDQLENLCITMKDFEDALKVVQPSSLREGFATVPNVTWKDIGALQDVREELQLSILAPMKHSKQFESLGLTKPAGILLCGPPGCGKTLLAKAISNESGINFISVKGPELLNMYVGESERAVRQCFQRARNSAPCIIFFDELDALCRRRSDSDKGSGVRVVDQLLTEMDGLESRKQVYVLGATNRPDVIDPAMLRPGRFDKILYVGLPDESDREDILKTITDNGTKPKIDVGINLSSIASDKRADGLTGADLFALVREASINAFKRFIGTNSDESQEISVSLSDFEISFNKLRPSVSVKDRKFYDKMKLKSAIHSTETSGDKDLSQKTERNLNEDSNNVLGQEIS